MTHSLLLTACHKDEHTRSSEYLTILPNIQLGQVFLYLAKEKNLLKIFKTLRNFYF